MSHRGQGTQQSFIPNTSTVIGLCFLKDNSLYLEIGRTSKLIEGFLLLSGVEPAPHCVSRKYDGAESQAYTLGAQTEAPRQWLKQETSDKLGGRRHLI